MEITSEELEKKKKKRGFRKWFLFSQSSVVIEILNINHAQRMYYSK